MISLFKSNLLMRDAILIIVISLEQKVHSSRVGKSLFVSLFIINSAMGNLSISLCSPHPEFEFDLQIHAHPLRALHSNFCYSIKTTKETKEIQCICSSVGSKSNTDQSIIIINSQKMCNRNLVNAMEEGPIQCYTVDGTEDSAKVIPPPLSLPSRVITLQVDKSSLCYGDFCFIRQSEEGRFTKGCLSIRQMGNEHHPYIVSEYSHSLLLFLF